MNFYTENGCIIVKIDSLIDDFFKELEKQDFSKKNIIIDATHIDLSKEIEKFVALKDKLKKYSLVIFSKKTKISNPDKLNIVPSLQEAFDIIQMEEIERDLGF